jgi:hypothetical protein
MTAKILVVNDEPDLEESDGFWCIPPPAPTPGLWRSPPLPN